MAEKILGLTLKNEYGNDITVNVPANFYYLWKALFGDLNKAQVLLLIMTMLFKDGNWSEDTLAELKSNLKDEPCQLLIVKNGTLVSSPEKTKRSGNWTLRYQNNYYHPANNDVTLEIMQWLAVNDKEMPIPVVRIDREQDSPKDVKVSEMEIVYL